MSIVIQNDRDESRKNQLLVNMSAGVADIGYDIARIKSITNRIYLMTSFLLGSTIGAVIGSLILKQTGSSVS